MNWGESVSMVHWEAAIEQKSAPGSFTHGKVITNELCFETNVLFRTGFSLFIKRTWQQQTEDKNLKSQNVFSVYAKLKCWTISFKFLRKILPRKSNKIFPSNSHANRGIYFLYFSFKGQGTESRHYNEDSIYLHIFSWGYLPSGRYILQELEDQELVKSIAYIIGCGIYHEVAKIIRRCQQQAIFFLSMEMCVLIFQ